MPPSLGKKYWLIFGMLELGIVMGTLQHLNFLDVGCSDIKVLPSYISKRHCFKHYIITFFFELPLQSASFTAFVCLLRKLCEMRELFELP